MRSRSPHGRLTMDGAIETRVLADAGEVARHAARFIAQEFRDAVSARGRFLLAVSGGTTPWRMLELLATEDLPWSHLHLFQVDERVVPVSDAARNLARLRSALLERVSVPADQVHAMPVEEGDLTAAARHYATTLREVAGTPPVLDLVQLGLGPDGHTASLVPGGEALDSTEDVALTEPYQGTRRMTLTFPAIDRARRIVWVVTGPGKSDALSRLLSGDRSIPAARVATSNAVLFTDGNTVSASPQ